MNAPLIVDEPLSVLGVRLAAVDAGIRRRRDHDLGLIELAPGSAVCAAFTRNRFRAAPVLLAEQHLAAAPARYLLVNAGNANAGTGEQGLADARRCCEALGAIADCPSEAVLPFSTGVIGEVLPVAKIEAALPELHAALAGDGWSQVAKAIMTTDTRPKWVSARVGYDEHEYTITGIAKGAGMIHPDMATMLAFVATDAPIPGELLRQALDGLLADSFNSITVDGDTSTNDACVLIATGAAGGPAIDAEQPVWPWMYEALQSVFQHLAKAIIRDAEGATKFVTIEVAGGETDGDSREVALTIAHSPLVKTALFASDPNWGRILAAIGRARLDKLDIARVSLWLNDVCIVRNGQPAADYSEERGQAVMDQTEITIRAELGEGLGQARIWTSDLSLDYVRINAEYRS